MTLCLSAQAAVTALQNTGTDYTNSPPFAIVTYEPPAASAENNYGAGGGTGSTDGLPHTNIALAQSFSIPVTTNTYVLTNIQLSVSGGASTNFIFLLDVGTNNNGAPTSPQAYTNTALSNLFSPGLNFVFNAQGSQGNLNLLFSGPDAVTLQGGHKYIFEIEPSSSTVMTWFRGGLNPPYPNGAAYRAGGNLNGGGNWREFDLAVGFVGITNLISTNALQTIANPPGNTYGPPTQFIYSAGTAAPTFSDGINTDEPFGTSTVMGETFLASRDFLLRNFYITCKGTTNSGNYVLILNDLGTNSLPVSFSPGANTNLAADAVTFSSFSPVGITNAEILKVKIPNAFTRVITNGHNYFLGFSFVGGGSNDMVLERTTGGPSYTNGAAYKGTTNSVRNDGFTGGAQNFIWAVDVVNPNPVITVTNAPLAVTWPLLPSASPNTPVIQTFTDPFTDNPVGLNPNPTNDNQYGSSNTAVYEGFGPGTSSPGIGFCQGFTATSNFNLGSVVWRARGGGSSNVLFTMDVWDVTNSYFTATDSIEHWPRQLLTANDVEPKAVPVFGTNVNFYYTTDNGSNGAGQGTNDQFVILTLPPQYQVPIQSGHIYAIGVRAETVGQNAATDGLFQLVRDVGQANFQIDLYPDLGDGIQTAGLRTNIPSAGVAHNVLPRGLTHSSFGDPEVFFGGISGAESPRTFVMAVYAAPAVVLPPITISNITKNGGGVTLTWNSSAGSTYTVLRNNSLTAPINTWPSIATGYPGGGAAGGPLSFTDTTPPAGASFYIITRP